MVVDAGLAAKAAGYIVDLCVFDNHCTVAACLDVSALYHILVIVLILVDFICPSLPIDKWGICQLQRARFFSG